MTDAAIRIETLTVLRFLAAQFVILFHFGVVLTGGTWLEPIRRLGFTAVSFFFVLSGFVLARAYLEPDGSLRGGVRRYLVNRAARLLPIYLLALGVTAVLVLRLYGDWSARWKPLLTQLLLVQSWFTSLALTLNYPGWSISTEVFFYACFLPLAPRLARSLRTSGRAAIALGAVYALHVTAVWVAHQLLGAELEQSFSPAMVREGAPASSRWIANAMDDEALRMVFWQYRPETWLEVFKFNPLVRLPEFVVGVLTALVFQSPWRRRVAGDGAAVAVFLGLGALLVVRPFAAIPWTVIHSGGLALPSAVVIYVFAANEGRLKRLCSLRPCVALGNASYSMYLLQYPVWLMLFGAQRSSELTSPWPVLAFLGTLIAVSLATDRWVERPVAQRLRSLLGHRGRVVAG